MANDFIRKTKASVTTSTGTSGDAIYTVPSTGGTAMECVVIGIYLSNKTNTGVTASVFLDTEEGSSTDVYLVKDGTNNDIVKLSCGTASALDATLSVLQDV